MPTARTQRYLAWAAVLGTLFACFGCGLYASNNVRVATLFLVVAWLILVPIFIYLLAVRRRSKRVVRQTLQQQEEQRQRELDALASVPNLLSKDQSSRADDASQSEKTV
ncbi:MAG: hypothetical protein IVW55_05345 [Chloroflexi bacterium]|nr:hypothetical protein [Chloroflexota bacterium]